MTTIDRLPIIIAFSLLGLQAPASVLAQQGATDGNWPVYASDNGSTKYSALNQINADNVDQLEIVWRRPALDSYYLTINPEQRFTDNYVAAPIVVDGIGYVPNGVGLVEAFEE